MQIDRALETGFLGRVGVFEFLPTAAEVLRVVTVPEDTEAPLR